jgi:hypothetical protein
MHVESILRQLQPLPGFVYEKVRWAGSRVRPRLWVHIRARQGSHGICSVCFKKRPGYDVLDSRRFAFVPLWGLAVFLVYAMRRVDCRRCGVTVEAVPWASGKMQTTHAFVWFLASWAKVLSWKEVARRFCSSWDTVFRCVEYAVQWGLKHRNLDGVLAIGVDELAWKKRHKYLTLVYQLDHGRRRLLHIARERTAKSFHGFFDMLGDERSKAIHRGQRTRTPGQAPWRDDRSLFRSSARGRLSGGRRNKLPIFTLVASGSWGDLCGGPGAQTETWFLGEAQEGLGVAVVVTCPPSGARRAPTLVHTCGRRATTFAVCQAASV